jgi:predicted dehydrogenase
MGHRDVRVAFVVDVDPERGQKAAAKAGAAYLRDVEGLIGNVDAAVVAVPTPDHVAVASLLLENGIATLVEKPLASSPGDARKLVEASDQSGTILMVGHVERFNPAILALPGVLSEPIHFELTRVSPFTPRVADGVIMDLMIHDLDILQSLVAAPVCSVQAISRTVRSGSHDLAVALLEFANGTTAILTASRLGQEKIRSVTITQPENVVRVDLIRQDITVHSQQRVSFDEKGSGFRSSGMVESPFIPNRGEPLALELDHFVSCVVNAGKPSVTGDDGVRAIELAQRVEACASHKS